MDIPLALSKLLIAHPHKLVRATNEQFPPAGTTFRVDLASESHWLQPVLVFTVHWWPTLVSVGGLLPTRSKMPVPEWRWVGQGEKSLWSWHVVNFQEIVFKGGPSFIRYKHMFSTMIWGGGLVRLKLFNSNWSSCTSRSSTCRGQNYFATTHQSLFWDQHFQTCVASPLTWMPCSFRNAIIEGSTWEYMALSFRPLTHHWNWLVVHYPNA